MNNAAVDSNIEPDCQQIEMDFCKILQICGLAFNFAKQMQLYKDQLHNKHVPFHKIKPAVKTILLT